VNAYVDASVALGIVLQEPHALKEWPLITRGITSELMRVECCRAFDRLVRSGNITDEDYAMKLAQVDRILATMLVLPISRSVLGGASRRFGVRIDTLDAIHLATAEQFRTSIVEGPAPLFATHDYALATAARHAGFDVIGAN